MEQTMQQYTFTSGSSALSTYKVVDAIPPVKPGGQQFLRLFGEANGSTGSFVVEAALVKAGVRIASFLGTATATGATQRTAADNGSGNYLCPFVWTETGTSTLDLLGATGNPAGGKQDPGLTQLGDCGAMWMIGVTTLTTVTSVVVRFQVSASEK